MGTDGIGGYLFDLLGNHANVVFVVFCKAAFAIVLVPDRTNAPDNGKAVREVPDIPLDPLVREYSPGVGTGFSGGIKGKL